MSISLLLAKIIGPYCIVVAIGIMLNPKFYQQMMDDFFKNSALLYLGGIMALVIGIVLVLFHNIWVAGWPVIITIFGWGGLIKGIWLIVFPNTVGKLVQAYQKKPALLKIHMAIVLVIGVLLTAQAYFA